jgi:hypothetical protein
MGKTYTPEELRSRTLLPALRYDFGLGIALALFIALLAAFVLYKLSPPDAVSADAPATEFSAGRAMKQLEVISRQPHPIGSAEHTAVRNYLLSELTRLGLQPEVQEASVISSKSSTSLRAGIVRNIVARLKGSGNGNKALLMTAHYDTMPNTPGAADDGASVATLLETLRALKSGPALSDDIIFLFTDGEEMGLLGAKAFVDEHPWAKDVGVVLNFEARGDGGPVVMFETSSGNGWLIGEFAEAAPHPVANSLSYEIYRLLPNDTDMTVFKGANLAGLNFANIDGFMRYHTQADNLANIDERSLQHHGSYALALARRFGNSNLTQAREANVVYFDILGRVLVRYPMWWVWPLTLLACVLFGAVLVYGLKRGGLTLKGVAAGFFIFVLDLVASCGIVTLLWRLNQTVQTSLKRSLQDDLYSSKLYFVACVLVALAVTSALYGLFRRRVDVGNLTVGALLVWLILLVATSVILPGGSFLLTWPLLFSLLALLFLFARRGESSRPLVGYAVLAFCTVPGIVLLVPMVYQIFVAMGLNALLYATALVVLLCGLLIPHFALMGGARRWLLPGVAAAAAVVLTAAAAFNSGFSERYPKSDNVFYVLNADTGQAAWVSADESPDEWTAQFFSPNFTRGSVREYVPLASAGYLKNPAPAALLSAGAITVTGDSTTDGVRRLQMRVVSSHEGINITVPGDAGVSVLAAVINGKRVESGKQSATGRPASPWGLQYWAPPAGGFDLVLELKGSQPVPLKVVEQSYGLPQVPGKPFTPRPSNIMPTTGLTSDFALIGKTYSF